MLEKMMKRITRLLLYHRILS